MVALGIGTVAVLIAGVFLAAAFRPEAKMANELGLGGQSASWTVAVNLTRQSATEVQVGFSIAPAARNGGQPTVVTAALAMGGMAGHEQDIPIARVGPIAWQGTIPATLVGEWALALVLDGERIAIPLPRLNR